MDQPSDNSISGIYEDIKRLGKLYIEDARYTLAEKVTLLLSAIAIFLICVMLAIAVLVFLAIGIANLLSSVIAPAWSYLIVSGIFIALIAVLILLRDHLVATPIARFVTKLFLRPPKNS